MGRTRLGFGTVNAPGDAPAQAIKVGQIRGATFLIFGSWNASWALYGSFDGVNKAGIVSSAAGRAIAATGAFSSWSCEMAGEFPYLIFSCTAYTSGSMLPRIDCPIDADEN